MQDVLHFERFDLRPSQRLVLVGGEPAAVGARAYDLLLALVAQRDRVVSRTELFQTVWADRVVEDNNLVVQIAALRKVLGADAITTIPGRGYRFTAAPLATPGAHANGHAVAPITAVGDAAAQPADGCLIGRDNDLRALHAEVDSHRLITIVGAGGMGKTRVARQLALERTASFGDDCIWVDLGVQTDSVLVPSVIASALGLQPGAADVRSTLLGALARRRRLLLILDNADQVAGAVCEIVAGALDQAPGVRFLVTSQVPLRHSIERTYRLGGLGVPVAGTPAAQALKFGAVALFVERAQAVDHWFTLDEGNVQHVISICQRLDGLALAIELAAARLPLLGAGGLAQAMDQRLHWLVKGRRDAPDRQQTLRATLEWTCNLLSDDERKVLRRLSVLAGSFTLAMALEVASDAPGPRSGGDALDEWRVADALDVLIERSLIAADTAPQPRYRLLDSPRVFALELLGGAGETRSIRLRHALRMQRHYVGAFAAWLHGGEAGWDRRYPAELDNLRAALDWALGEDGDHEVGLDLSANSGLVWLNLSLYGEGIARLTSALDRLRARTPPLVVGALWYGLAGYLVNGRPDAAVAPYASAAEAFRRSGDMVARGFALAGWALVKIRAGDVDQAVAALDEVETIVMHTPADNLRAMLAQRRWALHRQQGDLAGAEAQCRQALALYRKIGATQSATAELARLAAMAWDMGRLDEALEGFREAVAAMRHSASTTKGALGVCLTNLAGVHIARGEYGEALVVAREGMAMREEAGYVWGALDDLAVRAAHIGRAEDAARIAGCADEAYRERTAQRNHSGLDTRAQLRALLEDRLGPVVAKKLLAEGAAMTLGQACALALAS